MALEAARRDRESHPDEIETEHPGYLLSQDTFYVGYLKGVGRIYQQTAVDTYSSVSFGKVYTAKVPVTAADLLNDRVLPFFEEEQIPLLRVLTDRGTEFCGAPEKHPYEMKLGFPGKESYNCCADGGLLPALVFTPDITIHKKTLVFTISASYFTFTPLGITKKVGEQ